LSKKTAEPNEPPPAGSSDSPGRRGGLEGWLLPGLILGTCVVLGLVLRTPSTPMGASPAAPAPTASAEEPATPPDWTTGDGVDVLLRIVDRRWEPWPGTATRGGFTRAVPAEGIRVRAAPDRPFARLGGERLAGRLWTPSDSDRWEEQEDGGFVATVMLYPGKPLDVALAGPGAAVVTRVRCIDGHRRGVVCTGEAPSWDCDCRISSRVGVYSDRWSVPWLVDRATLEAGEVTVPEAVTACFRFPEVPAEERTVVVVAPQGMPHESAKEATSPAVAEGEVCVRAPAEAPLLIGLGSSFSPSWSNRDATPAEGTTTWTARPVADGTVTLAPGGGWASWPVIVGPTE